MDSPRMEVAVRAHAIEMHLRELGQLLDSLDPSPFHRRDLNASADEYIVDSVKELPKAASYVLVIHLDQSIGLPDEGRVVGDAIRTHFRVVRTFCDAICAGSSAAV